MDKVRLLIRGKKTTEIQEFTDMGDGQVKDDNGNSYQMVVSRPTGGYLRGEDRVSFTFPTN